MGDLLSKQEGKFASQTLLQMFNANIATTFAQIEELRKTYPRLLNPAASPGPRAARRQTLRFAAFLINDEIAFDGTYPAPRFRAWLKWLTWLGTQTTGTLTLNGATFNGTPSQLILKVMADALPPGGPPKTISFSWNHSTTATQLIVSGTTNAGHSISVTSIDHTGVHVDGDDEDDV